MDETNQMKSTAVAEVPLMNGDVNKGSNVDAEASNGPEKLDKKMNVASEFKPSGVNGEPAKLITDDDKQPAEGVSETETNLKDELFTENELLKDVHREHDNKNETLNKEQTEKEEKNETLKKLHTEICHENETLKQDKTGHSNENETINKEQTEHDTKFETSIKEQTDLCNENETSKQEQIELDNKSETLEKQQTDSCNDNESLNQENTEPPNETETLKQEHKENCNKSESLKEVHKDHCDTNETVNTSPEEVATDLKVDPSLDKSNKDTKCLNSDDEQGTMECEIASDTQETKECEIANDAQETKKREIANDTQESKTCDIESSTQESKTCDIERSTQESQACEIECDTQETKACEMEHDAQESKNEHSTQEMNAENEQLDLSIGEGQANVDAPRSNEETNVDCKNEDVLDEGNINTTVEEGSTEKMIEKVEHDVDTVQVLEEKSEVINDSVEKDSQDEENTMSPAIDANNVSEDTSEPMEEDTISALDKGNEMSETLLNANKMETKIEDCLESNVEVSVTESGLIGRSTLDKNESQKISVDSTELPSKSDLETEQGSMDEEVSAISEDNLNLNKDKEIAAGSARDNMNCKSSAISSLEEVSPDLKKTQNISDLTQSTQSESVGETPMECDSSIRAIAVETKVDNSINTKAVNNKNDLQAMEDKNIVKTPTKNSKLKSKTLDQVLSKITSIAENESQQKAVIGTLEAAGKTMPKKTARKSCAAAKPIPIPVKASITSLTFNVKELEKQGLLDIPKTQKRKAFEPMKIKMDPLDETTAEINSGSTKLKSPVRSPGKTENPFFKKKKLMRRKKGKRGYKLPGEKPARKGKKKKDVVVNSSEGLQENIGNCETVLPLRVKQKQSVEPPISHPGTVSPPISAFYHQSSQGKTQTKEQSSQQKNVLHVLPKTNKPLTVYTPSNTNSAKKAKKSVKSMDSMRKIDSFFIGGNNSTPGSTKLSSPHSVTSKKSTGSKDTDNRKRKATGTIPNASSPICSPEEKKRKMEETKSLPPPQLITLVSTGSSPLGMSKLHPVIHAPGTSPPNPILLAPGANTGSQTIIQNGTLNGLPMFQILNGPNGPTSQPQQLVAVGASQGQSLLQNSFPRTTTLLQSNRMPVLLSPVSMQPVTNNLVGSQSQLPLSSAVISSASLMTSVASSIHGTRLVSISNVLSGQQSSSEVMSAIPQTKVYLSNGQIVDSKLLAKNGSLPNGLLYPVTPPKTPENNGSSDSKDGIELSPGGTPLPDKDVIPLCTCKITGANFQRLALLVTYCQALDSVDGKVMGCCNKVTGTQMVRPAVKVPFLSLCEAHRKRLRVHQCCPGCGHFCTQGKFLQCKKDGSNSLHLFHEQCLVVRDGKNYCPHCGETSAHVEVQLSLEESKPSIMKDMKSSRVQTKARFTAKTASSSDETVEEPSIEFTFEKTKKTISTRNIPFGPDRHSLEKVLACLGQERPKKFRHLPKCLYTPAYDQDLERTLYMLEDGHDPNEKYDDLECQSALHAAATVGSLPIVHVLLQAGGSLHLQDKTLKTPLMCAAENNHLDVVKYLVKAGSIVDSKADDGMTALHYAAKAGYIDVLRILLESEQIIVDVTDDGGWTPLIWAVEHDQIDSVKTLLKRNADPNLRDSEENTTLHWAAFSGSVVIAELLLTAGCDLDSLNMHGDRPLHIAARQDHYECVVLFLARGADVEAKNNKGENPEECCLDKTTAVHLALKVNRQLKKFGAKHMGRPEKLLHRDLSKGRENIPIPCVNAVDDDGIPQDYLYVTDNIETSSLMVNRVIGSLQSCQCKDDCSSIYCACGKNSVRCWYDKFGRLIPEFNTLEPPLIFECNRACACWTTCNNRVVQNGVMSRLQVFKTDGRGWGCKTLVEIQRGTFICEYIGEHISDSEADRREDDSYLFDLDNRDGETYCIDARKYGNIARFINHLCEPNLVPVKVFVDSQDLRFPRICLFASRDIQAGEELGFDYGEKFWIIKWKHFTCTCGAPKCRYSKETIQKTLEEYYLRHDDEEAEVVNEEQQTNINTTPSV